MSLRMRSRIILEPNGTVDNHTWHIVKNTIAIEFIWKR